MAMIGEGRMKEEGRSGTKWVDETKIVNNKQ